jgi:Skp family chaperone for outer membrane proteins
MKLRVVRFSGMPVQPEALDAFNTEFKQEYDKLQEVHGNDMLEMHKGIQAMEAELQKKYSNIVAEKLPASKKAWLELLGKFDAPVMLARSSENTKELILVIMDQPLA